jgi:hypothetical protein
LHQTCPVSSWQSSLTMTAWFISSANIEKHDFIHFISILYFRSSSEKSEHFGNGSLMRENNCHVELVFVHSFQRSLTPKETNTWSECWLLCFTDPSPSY